MRFNFSLRQYEPAEFQKSIVRAEEERKNFEQNCRERIEERETEAKIVGIRRNRFRVERRIS